MIIFEVNLFIFSELISLKCQTLLFGKSKNKYHLGVVCNRMKQFNSFVDIFSSPGPKAPEELIGYRSVCLSIICLSVIGPSSVSTFDHLYLQSLQADLSHFLSIACLWWKIDGVSFSWKSNENLGCYGNHKVP